MKLFLMICMLCTFNVLAHEGGHGEATEGGKFGGITSPVVAKAQQGLGKKGKTLYVAELVRTASGKLSLYLFDEKMNLLKLDLFGAEVTAKLEVKKKGKFTYFGEFKLSKHGTHFMGQLPKVEYRPFNIDLFFSHGTEELFVGFSNLD